MQEVEIADLRRITEVVRNHHNYDFGNYAMSSFKRRIQRVLELYKMDTIEPLIKRLETDARFFREFLSEITVNVTEMFRDPTLWTELRKTIIPSILENTDSINIWHAGCSSGEEVFSMAITQRNGRFGKSPFSGN